MKKIISIFNEKGGVGKTVTAFVLCWYFALLGLKVLVLDLDGQANLTRRLLAGRKANKNLYNIIQSGLPIRSEDILSREVDNDGHKIDFVASSISLTGLEGKLPDGVPKEYFLSDLLVEVEPLYDVIIIDTPPNAEIGSKAALMASSDLIIPCTPDTMGKEGVELTMRLYKPLKSSPHGNPNLNLAGILVTKYNPRLNTAKEAVADLRKTYGNLVVGTNIREGNKIEVGIKKSLPVIACAPDYYVSKDYIDAINEMFKDIISNG